MISTSEKLSQSKHLVFDGYQGLIKDFWRIEEYTVTESVKRSIFFTSRVVVLDELSYDHPIMKQHEGSNEVEVIVAVNGQSFKAFTLAGDGGFNTYLFLASDADNLMKLDNTIKFLS